MAVTVDLALFDWSDDVRLLLIRRGHEPFQDCWALPGGFVDMDERVETAAKRELLEETGVELETLHFLGYFDAVDRDPRGRTLSFAFWGVVSAADVEVVSGDDAAESRWHPVDELPELAFDHAEIVARAVASLRVRLVRTFEGQKNPHY